MKPIKTVQVGGLYMYIFGPNVISLPNALLLSFKQVETPHFFQSEHNSNLE